MKEKLEQFKSKQAEIITKHREVETKKKELLDEAQAKVKALEEEMKKKISEIELPLEQMKESYKAELKAFAGITDGERTNVLDVVEMVLKLTGQLQ